MITGDPIILVQGDDLKEYGLYSGCKGIANSVIKIPESGDDLVYFMKNGTRTSVVISASRCVVDEEAKANAVDVEALIENM